MNRLIILAIASAFILAGCAAPQKKSAATVKEDDAIVGNKPVMVDKAVEQDAASDKKETKPESVVEVLPRKSESKPELILEPLPEEIASTTTPEKSAMTAVPESESAPAGMAETKTVVAAPLAKGDFVVTVDKKDSRHPYFGKGYPDGFLVDSVPGKEIVVERGKSYSIVVNTNPKHDVYLSEKDIGWGSSVWTGGVEGGFIYRGTITFKPDNKAPDAVYYSCRNHPYMGGKIHIVNPGETVEITQVAAAGAAPTAKKTATISASKVKQKLMFANMLLKSGTGKRVAESGIGEAIALQKKASELMADAERDMKADKNAEAFAAAKKALDMLKQSSRLVPSDDAKQQLKNRHKELLASIADYEKSHKDNTRRFKKAKKAVTAVAYDKDEVASLKGVAEKSANAGDFGAAIKSLEKAQNVITTALQKMLNSQTLTYDLNFETPKDEYEYELKRFSGYEELIPIAIEMKKPTKGAIQLMQQMLKKAQKMQASAKQKAGEGAHPVAIRMMLDATKTVRRALRMVGVMQ